MSNIDTATREDMYDLEMQYDTLDSVYPLGNIGDSTEVVLPDIKHHAIQLFNIHFWTIVMIALMLSNYYTYVQYDTLECVQTPVEIVVTLTAMYCSGTLTRVVAIVCVMVCAMARFVGRHKALIACVLTRVVAMMPVMMCAMARFVGRHKALFTGIGLGVGIVSIVSIL